MLRRRRILLDCDGVIADFCSALVEAINTRTGSFHTVGEINQYDVFDSLKKPELKEWFTKEVASKPGWCSSIKPFPEAAAALRRLNDIGEVVIVTAPVVCPNWAYERQEWLTKHFGIDRSHVVYTSSKQYVMGDALIDDSAENCAAWHKEHPRRLTLLWNTTYNGEAKEHTTLKRVNSWNDVYEKLERFFVSSNHA